MLYKSGDAVVEDEIIGELLEIRVKKKMSCREWVKKKNDGVYREGREERGLNFFYYNKHWVCYSGT